MALFSDQESPRALIPAIILWGCFGGLCFAAATYLMYDIFRFLSASCYADILQPLTTPWIFGTAIILSLVLGMIAAMLFCTGGKTDLHPFLIGLFSGICTALVGYMLVDFFHILGYTWIWPNSPLDVLRIYILKWSHEYVLYIIILGIPQAFGAWYQASRQKLKDEPPDFSPTSQIITGTRHRHGLVLGAILLLLLVIPLCIYVLPVDETRYCDNSTSCTGSNHCGQEPQFDNVTVSRISPDSIRVSLKAASKNCGSHNSFRILLDGVNVSTQELIGKSGLNVTITPREGLGRQDGSYAILQGSAVILNESSPSHIQILIIIPNRPTPFVQRDLYL